MAKTSYQNIPVELKNLVKKSLGVGDRFIIPRVSVRRLIPRRKILKGITQRSLLPEIANAWNGLSGAVQDSWTDVGVVLGMTGYKAFTKEYIIRVQNSLLPITTPSVFRHGKVGMIHIESPANDLTIRQDHPINYYIMKKVRGTKSQYEPSLVTEYISFPMELKISYKSILTNTSENYKARIYVEIVSNYQGRDIVTQKEINFSLSADWNEQNLVIDSVFGIVRGYTLKIEILNCIGYLYFDNVKLFHSSKNWVRDTQCNDIHQDFTKAFYQISKHWIAENLGDGANFESVYLS